MIEKLRLTEGRYLKRAAVLLFHPDPERFVTGASIKIGAVGAPIQIRVYDHRLQIWSLGELPDNWPWGGDRSGKPLVGSMGQGVFWEERGFRAITSWTVFPFFGGRGLIV